MMQWNEQQQRAEYARLNVRKLAARIVETGYWITAMEQRDDPLSPNQQIDRRCLELMRQEMARRQNR